MNLPKSFLKVTKHFIIIDTYYEMFYLPVSKL